MVLANFIIDVRPDLHRMQPMNTEDLRLPKRLRELRASMGVSQRQAAVKASVDVRWLCNVERGRRVGPPDTFVQKLCVALDLDKETGEELAQLARHDRVMRAVGAELPVDSTLLAVVLDATRELDPVELQGLVRQIGQITSSKRRLKELTNESN